VWPKKVSKVVSRINDRTPDDLHTETDRSDPPSHSRWPELMFNVQLLPQVLYIAAHATWPLKFYRELDRILAHAIWRMYHLPPSYPTDLIFLPKTDCGLNFKRISDLAQIQKWGMLGRTSALGPASTSITLPDQKSYQDSKFNRFICNESCRMGLAQQHVSRSQVYHT
jgi:hypothetical protein